MMLNIFRMRTLGVALSFLLIAALTACSQKQEKQESAAAKQPSPIVQKAEASGAGDLSNTSVSAMKTWFSNHSEVAQDIQKDCQPIQAKSPASWNDSVEGRVCQAATEAAGAKFPPMPEHRPMEGMPRR